MASQSNRAKKAAPPFFLRKPTGSQSKLGAIVLSYVTTGTAVRHTTEKNTTSRHAMEELVVYSSLPIPQVTQFGQRFGGPLSTRTVCGAIWFD